MSLIKSVVSTWLDAIIVTSVSGLTNSPNPSLSVSSNTVAISDWCENDSKGGTGMSIAASDANAFSASHPLTALGCCSSSPLDVLLLSRGRNISVVAVVKSGVFFTVSIAASLLEPTKSSKSSASTFVVSNNAGIDDDAANASKASHPFSILVGCGSNAGSTSISRFFDDVFSFSFGLTKSPNPSLSSSTVTSAISNG